MAFWTWPRRCAAHWITHVRERMSTSTILYLDDDRFALASLRQLLLRMGHKPICVDAVPEALSALAQDAVDLVLVDYHMPHLTGLDFLTLIRNEGYDIPVVMITGHASVEHAVSALKAGVLDYIEKPVQLRQLEVCVERALEFVRLQRENKALRREMSQVRRERQIVGSSGVMNRLLQTVQTVAPTRATVLLQGESGTGKELFARAIHELSDRADQPFVKINCAALPEGLFESALFGHEKGAFTGALKRTAGAFERANGGTLLLDEVTEMKPQLQAKLLRVLQELEFERLGGTTTVHVDVRIIATSNRDLAREVESGAFREDLYFRLNVVSLVIPSLRSHNEDVLPLAHHFAMRTAAETGRAFDGFARDAMELLQRYPWPGNVRELQHAVERAVILSGEPVLTAQHFAGIPYGLTRTFGDASLMPSRDTTPPRGTPAYLLKVPSLQLSELERVAIECALAASNGNRTKAAALLGVTPRTLANRLGAKKSEPEL